jgi:transposase
VVLQVARLERPAAQAPAPAARSRRRATKVELKRGAMTMKITWPAAAAADFAAFTRELLR